MGDGLHPRRRCDARRRRLGRERHHPHDEAVNRIRLYRRRRGTARASIYFAATVLLEVRRALLGHDKSWPTVRALLRPSERPPLLGRQRQSAAAMTTREPAQAASC